MARLFLILIFCLVSWTGKAVAEAPISENLVEQRRNDQKLEDFEAKSMKSRLDMLERRIQRLDREHQTLKDRLRALNRNVSDIRRRHLRP